MARVNSREDGECTLVDRWRRQMLLAHKNHWQGNHYTVLQKQNNRKYKRNTDTDMTNNSNEKKKKQERKTRGGRTKTIALFERNKRTRK